MPPVPISDDQAQQLQTKFSKLLNDKTAADAATATSNQAASDLVIAQQTASASTAAEATADALVNSDLQDLQAAFTSILGTAPAAPPTSPGTQAALPRTFQT